MQQKAKLSHKIHFPLFLAHFDFIKVKICYLNYKFLQLYLLIWTLLEHVNKAAKHVPRQVLVGVRLLPE